MIKYIVKENKIIKQENESYQPGKGETVLIAKQDEWPILKRTGGQFFYIHENDKKEGDIVSGGVLKYKVLRDKKEIVIDKDKKLDTDKLLEFIHPEGMIRVYRGGTSEITTVNNFDHKTEAIEKSYTKNDLRVENGKVRLRTEAELLDDEKEKAIQKKAFELSQDAMKIVDGTAKAELESFVLGVKNVTTLTGLSSLTKKG
jgi:hypothetical protein